MAKTISAIREIVRQMLRDEFQAEEDMAFEDDEIDLHIANVLTDISMRSPYEVKETVVSDGTANISLTAITNLIGDRVVKVEYPTGDTPRSFIEDFEIFGTTLTLDTEPTSGENIYLYCHKVHTLTESTSSLTPDLEKVLIDGTVAKTALAWLNEMRSQIVPSSARWYHTWVSQQLAIYQVGLNAITKSKAWKY
jgi:hypothetical protein